MPVVQLEQTGNFFHLSYFIKDQWQLNFIEVSMTTGCVVHFFHVYGRIKKQYFFLTSKHIAVADTSVTRTARDGTLATLYVYLITRNSCKAWT